MNGLTVEQANLKHKEFSLQLCTLKWNTDNTNETGCIKSIEHLLTTHTELAIYWKQQKSTLMEIKLQDNLSYVN